MATNLQFDDGGDYEKLEDWLKRAADRVIAWIKDNPERMTKQYTHGARFWYGMQIEDGRTCYFSIYFDYIPESDAIRIISIDGAEMPGLN